MGELVGFEDSEISELRTDALEEGLEVGARGREVVDGEEVLG